MTPNTDPSLRALYTNPRTGEQRSVPVVAWNNDGQALVPWDDDVAQFPADRAYPDLHLTGLTGASRWERAPVHGNSRTEHTR